MTLDVSGRRRKEPREDEVVAALESDGWTDDGFVILSRAPEEYVQTAGGLLEHRSDGRHFRAAKLPVSRVATERVFVGFLRGEDSWRSAVEWSDVTTEVDHHRVGSRSRGLKSFAFFVLFAVALAIWLLLR